MLDQVLTEVIPRTYSFDSLGLTLDLFDDFEGMTMGQER
jgi:hypothetical protein